MVERRIDGWYRIHVTRISVAPSSAQVGVDAGMKHHRHFHGLPIDRHAQARAWRFLRPNAE
jgi:hypothetical protein